MKNCFSPFISRFRRNVCGGVAIMAGLTIGLIGAGVIAAVDITDMNATKSKMQDRLDSAVLFVTLQDDLRDPNNAQELQETGRKFVLDAVKNSNIRADDIVTDFKFDPIGNRIIADVSFTPPAIFVGAMIAPRGLNVRAEATALEPIQMEVALVLDMSGSMNFAITNDIEEDAPNGSRRIDALRDGVDALVTAIDGNNQIAAEYSVIPYATSVDLTQFYSNAGTNKNAWFEGANGEPLPTVCSGGRLIQFLCTIFSDLNGRGVDEPSPPGAWGAELYSAKNGDGFTISLDPPQAGGTKVPVVTQGTRGTLCNTIYIERYGEECVDTVTIDGTLYIERDWFAPRVGPMGLTDEADDVASFMNGLSAEGATAGHVGAAWGLYALTPEWDEVFDHAAGKPEEFHGETQKVLIIMTDGDFTVVHDDNLTLAETYGYFQSVCAKARAQGVAVYTVGLRSSTLTDAELTECAGDAENYFSASSRSALVESFEKIAEKESRVRLSH